MTLVCYARVSVSPAISDSTCRVRTGSGDSRVVRFSQATLIDLSGDVHAGRNCNSTDLQRT